MNGEKKKIKRRYARTLGNNCLVIDVTDKELELIKLNKIEIERVKTTPDYVVYRKKPR